MKSQVSRTDSFGFQATPIEVGLYRRYLDALGRATNLLLEESDDENWVEALQLLAKSARVEHCALYLNEMSADGKPMARQRAIWSSRPVINPGGLRELDYDTLSLLNDTLQIGMVFTKDMTELPSAEFGWFKGLGIASVMCIPLLVGGEMIGFLGFFCQRDKQDWLPMEIDILCVAANNFAATLARQGTEHSLRASESRLRVLVGATEDIVIEFDANNIIHNVWSNHSLLPPSSADGQTLNGALPDGMAHALMAAAPRVLESGRSEVVRFALGDMTGGQFFSGRLQTVPTDDGRGLNLVALIRDVTEQMQAEARRQTMLDTLDLLEEAIIDMTPQGRLTDVSAGWGKLRGDEAAGRAVTDQSLLQFVHPEDRAAIVSTLAEMEVGSATSTTMRFRLFGESGECIWVEARLLAHRSPQGQVTCMRGILRDVTASYLEQTRITQMALHDPLTQLPNRILLHDHLQQAIVRAQRNGTKVALGFIDLDHFKQINDTLGHQAGDTVLLTLSRRLHEVLREMDTLSRWGGDEFVALLPDAHQEGDVRMVASRLMEAGRQPIQVDGQEILPTLSIGFAVFPDDAENAETLMAIADHTMFHAKRNGRNNVRFYRDVRTENRQPGLRSLA